jgi:alcohol dehydrogenase (cytochrome c)
VLYAVDARTGKFVESFGEKGVLPLINRALTFKYPGKYPDTLDPRTLGYRLAAPPAYFNNTLYVGLAASANLIPGGLLMALDATTGAVKWVFTTVPQGPGDDGWELTKDTWGYGRRFGGGIWTQPSIDPALGIIYFNASNPSPDYDGTGRLGMNLFTNSIMALHLATGKLAWYFQTTHHDLWDSDLANGPVLFDVTAGGKAVKGIASFGKTCYAYVLNRETGQPINPIVEMPVPTTTDVPGEKPWPTQPIPFTSAGTPQQPFCTVYPIVGDPEAAKRVRPQFHPFLMHERVISSPGVTGGATWGSSSFSPRTGFLYVAGKNQVASLRVKVVGDTVNPGPGAPGFRESFHDADHSALTVSQTVAAYDALTGAQVWRTEFPGATNAGNLVTGGDVLFQAGGSGAFFAFDARTGRQLFKFSARVISGSPLTYQVRGKQYVTTIAGNTVLTFSLP